MTYRDLAEIVSAALETSLSQMPNGATIGDAISGGAITAAANNAVQALVGMPIDLILVAMSSLEGARSLTVRQPGERVDIEIGCVGTSACADLAALVGAQAPQTLSVGGMSWTWSTLHRDDGASVTVTAHGAHAQDRAA